jgi:hypothetical protein
VLELKKKLKHFDKLQEDYYNYIKNILIQGIDEYKAGKIKPYFFSI